MNSRAHFFAVALLLSLTAFPLAAQTEEARQEKPFKLHLLGLAGGMESRTITLDHLTSPRDAKLTTGTAGLNYSALIGDRLGYYSDLFVQLPLASEYSPAGAAGKTGGILLDYTGGIGWNIWLKNWCILPGAGFHLGLSWMTDDPSADNGSSFYTSFGFGSGLKVLYRFSSGLLIYTGGSLSIDTVEFSSHDSYRDRENKFKRSFQYMISAGVGKTF